MGKAAIYGRVSTKVQKEEGTSLESQVEAMRAWAQKSGHVVTYEFAEDMTGATLDRPKLTQIRELARDGQIDLLAIYSWDRLSRDPYDAVTLLSELERSYGVKVVCVTEPEMPEEIAMLYRFLMGWVARQERQSIRERVARGMRQAAITKGQLPSGGRWLFGYDYQPKSKGGDGKRTINEAEARVVRLIFRWFTEEAMSLRGIAVRLGEMAIRTKKGLDYWHHSTIYRILTNPAYCGRAHAFRWKNVEPEDEEARKRTRRNKKSSTRLRPREEWIELDTTPAIVSEEIYEAAQQRLKERRALGRKPKHPYLLRSMVKCYCGGNMVGSTSGGRWHYYRCAKRRGVERVHHHQVPAGALEREVWAGVNELLTNPDVIFRQLEEKDDSQETILGERIAEAESAISSLDVAERRAISLYSLGKIDKRKVDDEVDRIRTEREAWKEDLARLKERLQAKVELAEQEDTIIEVLKVIGNQVEGASFQQKRKILEALRVQVHMKRGPVEWPPSKARELSMPVGYYWTGKERPWCLFADAAGLSKLLPEDPSCRRRSARLAPQRGRTRSRYSQTHTRPRNW